ncbi:hypothetical protein V8D89_003647 [Ganoderma adspersum]
MCGSESREEAAILGYPSTISLARALNTWVAMHAWSLGTIAEASGHTGEGVDYALENQCAVVFVLLSREQTFVLEQGGLVSKDERTFLRAHWSRLERTCKTMADAMRETLSGTERRAFAGFIPAAFHFKETGMVAFHQYPLFRLQAHECGPSYKYPVIAEDSALFTEVVNVWGLLINDGLVLRAHHSTNYAPLLQTGKCVQLAKSWAWLAAQVEWDTEADVSGAHKASRRKSGLSPTELYKQYYKLLVQRNFEFVTTRKQKLVLTIGKNEHPAPVETISSSTSEGRPMC